MGKAVSNRKDKNKNKGFTLVEVMIVLVIIGIMAGIAAPQVMSWLPNMRLNAEARDLFSAMQRAKVEAVRRNTCVSISFVTVTHPATGGGYTSFIDNGDGAGGIACDGIQNGTEALLTTAVAIPANRNVSLVTANNIGGPQAACFNSKSLVCGSQAGNVTLRNDQGRWHRVRVMAAGSIQLETSNDGTTWN